MSDLFGYMATRFGRSPEDLATEGLCYILNQPVAGEAFVDFINAQCDADLPSSLMYRTQKATDEGEGQPDMDGIARDGSTRLFVESKFWAGLTANQPTGYLRDLSRAKESVLLFVVPHPRREYLWPKIRDRAAGAFEVEEHTSGYRLRLSGGTTLLLASWRDTLSAITSTVQARSGQRDLLEDIRQVQGLCERYSREGFVPLRGEELGQDVGKRVWQVAQLVQDLRQSMGGKWWSVTSSMATSQKRYGFKAELFGYTAVVGIKYFWWARRGQSPIWLRVKATTPSRRDAVVRALVPTFAAFADKPTTYPTDVLLPVSLKPGVERGDVLEDLQDQLADIARRLRPVLEEKR